MQKTLGKIITLSLFTATITYASNENSLKTIENKSNTGLENTSYKHMSTAQLQEEVEKRSLNGDLSFNMGMELMKRWSRS